MGKEKHVHFTLSPDNPREKKIIEILEKLPNRQEKSFIVSLIEGQAELQKIAAEVHALAMHFGISGLDMEVDFTKFTSKQKDLTNETEQLPGQVCVYDIDEQPQTIIKQVREPRPKSTAATRKPDPQINEPLNRGKQAEDSTDMPDAVVGFMGNFSDWGDDDE